MNGTDMLAQYCFAIAITFGLLALLGWLATHYGHKLKYLPRTGAAGTDLALLGRLSVGPQHQLLHVRWKKQEMLIASGPQGLTLVSTTPPSKKT